MTTVSPRVPKTISHEEFADLIETSRVVASEDRGSSISHQIDHPQRGPLVLTSNVGDDFCTVHAA